MMATEAQRLIGISLTKIAQSRGHRGGISLHKNLLVATVLQKARYIFMEEAYNMMHSGNYRPMGTSEGPPVNPLPISASPSSSAYQQPAELPKEDNLIAVTPEEVGLSEQCVSTSNCVKCNQNQVEYNYVDKNNTRERNRLKRRCNISDWETEEAILSILPKRSKHVSASEAEATDIKEQQQQLQLQEQTSVDDLTQLSACVSSELCDTTNEHSDMSSSIMEIDRITSLVSIFSFTNFSVGDTDKLTRSVSTPDLCSAQAKETIQQRPVIAMTV